MKWFLLLSNQSFLKLITTVLLIPPVLPCDSVKYKFMLSFIANSKMNSILKSILILGKLVIIMESKDIWKEGEDDLNNFFPIIWFLSWESHIVHNENAFISFWIDLILKFNWDISYCVKTQGGLRYLGILVYGLSQGQRCGFETNSSNLDALDMGVSLRLAWICFQWKFSILLNICIWSNKYYIFKSFQ